DRSPLVRRPTPRFQAPAPAPRPSRPPPRELPVASTALGFEPRESPRRWRWHPRRGARNTHPVSGRWPPRAAEPASPTPRRQPSKPPGWRAGCSRFAGAPLQALRSRASKGSRPRRRPRPGKLLWPPRTWTAPSPFRQTGYPVREKRTRPWTSLPAHQGAAPGNPRSDRDHHDQVSRLKPAGAIRLIQSHLQRCGRGISVLGNVEPALLDRNLQPLHHRFDDPDVGLMSNHVAHLGGTHLIEAQGFKNAFVKRSHRDLVDFPTIHRNLV